MNLLARARPLRQMGVLGMNRRNAECSLDLNPRARFPLVDSKKQMRELCRSIHVPTPEIYAVVAAHSALRHLPRLLEPRASFVIKPNRGAGGRGVLVITGRDGPSFVRHNGERLAMDGVSGYGSSIISGFVSLGGRAGQASI